MNWTGITDERRIATVAHELRSWNAVAIIGAGASLMSGFPLTQQLLPLLWQAIDADEAVRRILAQRFGSGADDAKVIIRDDPAITHAAYELIATSSNARAAFQNGFSRLDAERAERFSPAHDALAELLHRRALETVVSFNWDTLTEAAYRRRYGRTLRSGEMWLVKPHGDATDPSQLWVLPHEAGYVPDYLIEHFTALALQRPRLLLIIGYSERDAEVVKKLISPLEERWRVVRISPSASGEEDIPLAAEQALPMLLRAVTSMPETPGWEYVTFNTQRDVGAALSGLRLGPSDVEACPRLAEVETVKRALLMAGSAIVVGGSGHGKSITAYQAAYDLSRDGWEVIRLTEPMRPSVELAAALSSLPWRTVAIVDDAQILETAKLQRLLEHSSTDVLLLVTSTHDVPFHSKTVTIAAERAVRTLADALLARRSEVLPIVSKLDRRVGEGYLDEPLEGRIEAAVHTATQKGPSPWLFCFALTGGWDRARDEVAVLKERHRADLLLAAIAVRQLLLLDGDVDRAWLDRSAVEFGRDRTWVDRSLELLLRRKAILVDTGWRCPHARYASEALSVVCALPRDAEWPRIVAMLRAALRYQSPSLRGLDRLLFDLWFADAMLRGAPGVINDELLRFLQERCWSAQSQEEKRDAALLLRTLLRWRRGEQLEDLYLHAEQLAMWLQEATPVSMPGLHWLINDCYNESKDLAETICSRVDPIPLIKRFVESPFSDAYIWAKFLHRLGLSNVWKDKFRQHLDRTTLLRRSEGISPEEAVELVYLAESVTFIDRSLSLRMVERALGPIAEAFNRSPIEGFIQLQEELFWHVLGYYPSFLRQHPPSAEQKRLARDFAKAIDPLAVARDITFAPRRKWQVGGELLLFLSETDRRQYTKAVKALDLDVLDKTTKGLWGEIPHELMVLLRVIGSAPDFEPSRSWIMRHTSELKHITSWLAALSPESVVEAMNQGYQMDLAIHSGLNWGIAAVGLAVLAEREPQLAVRAAQENRTEIAKGLLLPSRDTCNQLEIFVQILIEVAPGFLESVLAEVDPVQAEANWIARLRGKAAEQRAVAVLLSIAASVPGEIGDVARRLLKRFPGTSRKSSR